MARYVIETKEAKEVNSLIRKYSQNIPIETSNLRGVFSIVRHREYRWKSEVELVFEGEVFCNVLGKNDWYKSSLQNQKFEKHRVSQIKLNRFIKKSILPNLRSHLKHFCVEVKWHSDITKLRWI